MTNDSSSGAEMPRKAALFVGGTLFVLGWLCPLFVPVVAASNLPTAWKAVASGALLIGLPELLTVAAIAILGSSSQRRTMSLNSGANCRRDSCVGRPPPVGPFVSAPAAGKPVRTR